MKYLFLLLSTIWLSACSSLLTSNDNVQLFYVLNPAPEVIQVQHPAPVKLAVVRPAIPAWLDTQHIILRYAENKVDFYAGARWVTDAGDMLGRAITQSLENNRVASDIFYAGIETQADYVLMVEILAFQANYDKLRTKEDEILPPPVVEVSLQGKLMKMPENTLQSQFSISNSTPAERDQLTDIIEAFDSSLQKSLIELVEYTAYDLRVKNSEN